MIRRNVTTENGQPCWLLVSQVEHARISGELAENWVDSANASSLALINPEELLPAIYHHDDGWRHWEQSPEVDPQTGRPLAFTEMPLEVALEIWRKSIRKASEFGPLAAWVVASHFTVLLGKSQEADKQLAIDWLEEFELHRRHWLQAWESENPAQNSPPHADTALHQLQLFDLLSLWLCMAERTAPQQFETPGGSVLTLTPQIKSHQIGLAPWPLKVGELQLSVAGKLVPARAYANSAELNAMPEKELTLSWYLVPDEAAS